MTERRQTANHGIARLNAAFLPPFEMVASNTGVVTAICYSHFEADIGNLWWVGNESCQSTIGPLPLAKQLLNQCPVPGSS